MAQLLTEVVEAADEGLNTDSDPAAQKLTAPEHANLLVHREGLLPMRGPIINHAELAVGTDEIHGGAWHYNNKLLLSNVLKGTYSSVVLGDTPSLYWRLGTNGTDDQTVNNRDGTGAGGITIGGVNPGALAGDADLATDFDGTDDRITSTYAVFGAGSVRTFEGWAMRDTSSSDDVLIAGDGGLAAPKLFLVTGTQDVRWRVRDNDTTAISQATWAGAWPGNGVWVHWVLMYDNTNAFARLYINGVLKGSRTGLTQTYSTPGNFEVGAFGTSVPFDGKMDEVATYEVNLPVSKIQSHYLTGLQTATREPWVAPYRKATNVNQLAVPKNTMKLVDLDANTVTDIAATNTYEVIGGRGARLGDNVYGLGYAHNLEAFNNAIMSIPVGGLAPWLYWRLDETSGTTAADASGNARTGTYTGTFNLNQPGALATNASVKLNGNADFVSSGVSPFTTGQTWTYMGWMYWDSTIAQNKFQRTIFAGAGGASAPWLNVMYDDGTGITGTETGPTKTDFEFYAQANVITPASFTLWSLPGDQLRDRWVHWALVVSDTADTHELYINGQLVGGTQTGKTTAFSVPGNFRLGSLSTDTTRDFAGRLDEVAIYDSFLSAAMIQSIYASRDSAQGSDGSVQYTRRLLKWPGTATVPTPVDYAPVGGQDVISHLNRIWVLGGVDTAGGGGTLEQNTLFFSDQAGPTTQESAKWQDDVSGLANKIVVANDDPHDFGVGLAKSGENLLIFKRHSFHALYGYSASTFQIRTISSDIGCVDKRSIVQYDEGCYFMSDQGYMYYNGEEIVNVASNLRREMISAMENTVGDQGADGGRVVATKLPNDYILLTIMKQTFSTGAQSADDRFCALLHTPSESWSRFSSGALADPTPSGVGKAFTQYWLSDSNKIVKCNRITVPEATAENVRGFDEVTVSSASVKGRIPAKWYSRLAKLATYPYMSQLHRLMMNTAFVLDGASDGGSGWFVSVVGGDGRVLVPEFQLPAMGDPSSFFYRRMDVQDHFTEAADAQVRVEWKDSGGTYPAVVRAEIFEAILEYQVSRQRRAT